MSAPLVRHEIHITVQQKGIPMSVAVILDLRDDVSAPLLKHFLSYLPEDFDDTTDLRWESGTDGLPHFFVISLPLPSGDDQTTRVCSA